jgi:uncharacterized membrane protein YhaH (DUF805 family)
MKNLLLGFEGRIGRGAFWAVQLPLLVLDWLYLTHIDPLLARWFPYSVFEGLAFALIVVAPLVWAQCAITVKRCHDRGRSGFWTLLLLIPIVGQVWLLVDCGMLAGVTASAPTAPRSAP